MIFLDPSSVSYTTPPPLKVYPVTGFFLIGLDPTWTFPVFVQWDIEYSSTPNPVTTAYGPWIYAGSATPDSVFNFFNVNLVNSYRFRYRVRSKNEVSPFSAAVGGGKIKVVKTNLDGSFSVTEV